MYSAFTVETIRQAEAAEFTRVGDGELMQRAAFGLAVVVLAELRERTGRSAGSRVLLAIGSGNNGGDGLFAAARLAARGVRVTAWRTGGSVHEAGWDEFLRAGGREVDAAGALAELSRTQLVIDAVTGIGGKPGLRDDVAGFAAACRGAGVPVVAVDLPSGLSADPPWDLAVPHVTADVTVTFGGHKPCHVVEPARSACGRIHLVDIGLRDLTPEARCWEPADVRAIWPSPQASSDKYSRGVVGIDAGSGHYPGAGVLVTTGAVRAGAGMVRFIGSADVARVAVERMPNVVTGRGRVQSLVLGSGWGDRQDGPATVAGAVASGVPVVLDADALTMLPSTLHRGALLTPHAGELARLLGISREQVTADPIAAARQAAGSTGATVLLKGATQVVATSGSGTVDIAVPGPARTAQAGSGDLLAGICGTLLAAGLSPREAAVAGASVQAMAARLQHQVPPQELDLQAALD